MKILGKMFTECADFRRTGSAALDLAYVAAARVDGYFEIGLKPWDFAAGELIAREAGALVCDFTGGHNYRQPATSLQVTRALLKPCWLTCVTN